MIAAALPHRLLHCLEWQPVVVVSEWRGDALWIGAQCTVCGETSGWHESRLTREMREFAHEDEVADATSAVVQAAIDDPKPHGQALDAAIQRLLRANRGRPTMPSDKPDDPAGPVTDGRPTMEMPSDITAGAAATRFLPSADERFLAEEPILQFFAYAHLPAHLITVSSPFGVLARQIVATLPRNPERTVALRKLLEAKDAAVRAKLFI